MLLQHLPHFRLSAAFEMSLPCPRIQMQAQSLRRIALHVGPKRRMPGFRFIPGSSFSFQDPLSSGNHYRRIKSRWHTREDLLR
jgi:hypothetical protein